MKPKCRTFMERLCLALGEDLDSPACRELEEHLESCPDCTLQLDSVRRTVEIYRSIPCAHVPGEMQKRLLARLNLPIMDLPEEL